MPDLRRSRTAPLPRATCRGNAEGWGQSGRADPAKNHARVAADGSHDATIASKPAQREDPTVSAHARGSKPPLKVKPLAFAHQKLVPRREESNRRSTDDATDVSRPNGRVDIGRYIACVSMNVASSKEMFERFDAVSNCTSPLTRALAQTRSLASESNPPAPCNCPIDATGVNKDYSHFTDRCWNPRMLCSLKIEMTEAQQFGRAVGCPPKPLFVVQGPGLHDGSAFQAGRYVTVIGPAAAMGTNALLSFADELRTSLRGVQMLNFGKSGAGPRRVSDQAGEPRFRVHPLPFGGCGDCGDGREIKCRQQ